MRVTAGSKTHKFAEFACYSSSGVATAKYSNIPVSQSLACNDDWLIWPLKVKCGR